MDWPFLWPQSISIDFIGDPLEENNGPNWVGKWHFVVYENKFELSELRPSLIEVIRLIQVLIFAWEKTNNMYLIDKNELG